MPTDVNELIGKLTPARRRKIEGRAAELLAEELTLQELRRARKLTQMRMAKTLGIGQDQVSKLETRSDMLISTLRKVIEGMGGSLSLVASFPDHRPISIAGIAALDGKPAKLKATRR